jgi:hypothetical protein
MLEGSRISEKAVMKRKNYPSKTLKDRLCGLVIRVPGYRPEGSGFDSRHYKKKSCGSGMESTQPREYN